ncbi:hypothetical protein [Nocardia farcinica]|uniref:hypothetical protein n=1 Tax=Nocardia farcinica TaxID=37329 RepID=UPI002458A61B|nr:hypothetical protein [Nocardia farcinica]
MAIDRLSWMAASGLGAGTGGTDVVRATSVRAAAGLVEAGALKPPERAGVVTGAVVLAVTDEAAGTAGVVRAGAGGADGVLVAGWAAAFAVPALAGGADSAGFGGGVFAATAVFPVATVFPVAAGFAVVAGSAPAADVATVAAFAVGARGGGAPPRPVGGRRC